MTKVLVSTVPFSESIDTPTQLLISNGIEFVINPLNRKLTESDLMGLLPDFDAIIAGTEPITRQVLSCAKKLKLISRVGVGLDNVDLIAARDRDIKVCYTPEAPAPAVSELTIALILSLLRSVHLSNIGMHKNEWYRYIGHRISEVSIGVVGLGRIGSRVIKLLEALGARKIYVNDIDPHVISGSKWPSSDIDELLANCDLITLHLPLTNKSKNLIAMEQLVKMKKNGLLVNTSRGGIINENDLAQALISKKIRGAAIDVFENEPYMGPLSSLEMCLLTSHMGSMSKDCRSQMEVEATQEVIKFFQGKALSQLVPDSEYALRELGKL